MEIQLQDLLDQIKKDGVAAAQAEAASILADAKAEAEKIVADAKQQADKLIASAKAENQRMVASSEDAIRQAGRNLLISFRESVSRELTAITGESVTAVYSSEALAQLVIQAVENWAKKTGAEGIRIYGGSERTAANAFYKACGYDFVKPEFKFKKDF